MDNYLLVAIGVIVGCLMLACMVTAEQHEHRLRELEDKGGKHSVHNA